MRERSGKKKSKIRRKEYSERKERRRTDHLDLILKMSFKERCERGVK